MNISNETTFSWVNGWSVKVVPSWNACKVSVMGPRQVFYAVSKDLTYMQPSADEVPEFLTTGGLTKLLTMLENMPSRVMIEPFKEEEEPKKEILSGVPLPSSMRLRAKPPIVDNMCRVCGGETKQVGTVRACDDCGHGAEGVAYDPNEFNSMQS